VLAHALGVAVAEGFLAVEFKLQHRLIRTLRGKPFPSRTTTDHRGLVLQVFALSPNLRLLKRGALPDTRDNCH
jgi:hypothetical protein